MIRRIIHRPIAVTMTLIAIVVLGVTALFRLPVSLMPDIDFPTITISISKPGASAREIDEHYLYPIKNQLLQVVGLQDIHTEARNDIGTIRLDFESGADIDMIYVGVNEKLDRAMNNLSRDIERPRVVKAAATDIPAFYMNIKLKEGNRDSIRMIQLSTFVRDILTKRFEQLPQTAMVDVSGCLFPQYLLIPDMEKLASMGTDVSLLETAIKNNNIVLGTLSIKDGQFRYNIHFDSKITSKEDIENIYLKCDGRLYRFKDLAQVVEQPQPRDGRVKWGEDDCISLAIIKQADARMEDLQENIDVLLTNLEKEYPNLQFELTRDQTKLLSFSIDNLNQNLIIGAVLACLVVFFFMRDMRSPFLVIITIPTSLIVTLLVFHIMHISINIISLSGLILGVGMMVDNSIIVIDSIAQKTEEGEALSDAIPHAANEVFVPMLSSVLTTCSVFIPLIFLSGVSGALFYDQAMAVTISLFASLLVSVTIIPVYYYLFYRNNTAGKPNSLLRRFTWDGYYTLYERVLKWTFRHQKFMGCLFLLLIPLSVFVYFEMEKSKLPEIRHDDVLVTIDWNSGITLDENTKRIESILKLIEDESVQATSMIGKQQYLLGHTKDLSQSEAILYIKCKSPDDVTKVNEKITRLFVDKYPSSSVDFGVSGNIFDMLFADNQPKLVARIQKADGSELGIGQIRNIISVIRDSLPDVYIPRPVTEQIIRYIVDNEALALYGVTYKQIYAKLATLIGSNELFKINKGGYAIPVINGETQKNLSEIMTAKIKNNQGVDIPIYLLLRQTIDEELKRKEAGSGYNYYPVVLDVRDKDVPRTMDKVNKIIQEDEKINVEFAGNWFSSRKLVNELIIILLVSISLLYFILAAQFESIVQPIIILTEIVIDIFFVILILWLLGITLNMMSLIGIIVMSGVVINDSILKIDTINRNRRNGMSLLKAIFVGGHSRLKPILMTSLTTILAVLPFLSRGDMGSDLQYPLSVTIVVGMSIGTLVSLFFIPVLYYVIYRKSAK